MQNLPLKNKMPISIIIIADAFIIISISFFAFLITFTAINFNSFGLLEFFIDILLFVSAISLFFSGLLIRNGKKLGMKLFLLAVILFNLGMIILLGSVFLSAIGFGQTFLGFLIYLLMVIPIIISSILFVKFLNKHLVN